MVFCTLWLGLLLGGSAWLRCHQPQEAAPPKPAFFSARHALPENYRLGKSDLDWNSETGKGLTQQDFLGRYLAKEIKANQTVTRNDLRLLPVVKWAAEKEAFLLPLGNQQALVESINAGDKVSLFEENRLILQQIPVLALLCDPPEGTSCAAIISLDREQGQLFAHSNPSKIRVVVGTQER